jgi:hypothetical protein
MMKSLPTPSLMRKLSRWMPSAHFCRTPDGKLCLTSKHWSQNSSNRHADLRSQVLELLEGARTQTLCSELQRQAAHAEVMLGRITPHRRHLEFEIFDL